MAKFTPGKPARIRRRVVLQFRGVAGERHEVHLELGVVPDALFRRPGPSDALRHGADSRIAVQRLEAPPGRPTETTCSSDVPGTADRSSRRGKCPSRQLGQKGRAEERQVADGADEGGRGCAHPDR